MGAAFPEDFAWADAIFTSGGSADAIAGKLNASHYPLDLREGSQAMLEAAE